MDTMEKSSRVLLQLFFDEDEYLVLQLNLFSSLPYSIIIPLLLYLIPVVLVDGVWQRKIVFAR